LFNQGIQNSTRAVLSQMGLSIRFIFRAKSWFVMLGRSLIDLVFTFSAMLVVNALYGFWPNLMSFFLSLSLLVRGVYARRYAVW